MTLVIERNSYTLDVSNIFEVETIHQDCPQCGQRARVETIHDGLPFHRDRELFCPECSFRGMI